MIDLIMRIPVKYIASAVLCLLGVLFCLWLIRNTDDIEDALDFENKDCDSNTGTGEE